MLEAGESSAERLARYGGVQHLPYAKLDLFQRKEFLPPDLCAQLIELIDAGRRPSTLADHNGDQYFRTSETCDLAPGQPAVMLLEEMLLALNGIDPAHGEPVQGQRYEVGQEFKAHVDWFNPHGQDWEKYCKVAGQRTWTFMIGGATRFKVPRKNFQPETGKLLCWNNRKADASGAMVGNVNTMHHGMKVRKGVKYVITKWYREKPWGW
jgi:prolyl 4-hydroxylase